MSTPFRNPLSTPPSDPDFAKLLGYNDYKQLIGLQVIEVRKRLGQLYVLPDLKTIYAHIHKYIEEEKQHWMSKDDCPYALLQELFVILTNHLFLDVRDVMKVFIGRVGNECCVRSGIKLSNRISYMEDVESCVIFNTPPTTYKNAVCKYMEFVDKELAAFIKLCGNSENFISTMFFTTMARLVIGAKEILSILNPIMNANTPA